MAVSATALKTTPKKPRIYVWQARTKAGELKKGEMEALDGSTVETRIRALGLAPATETGLGMRVEMDMQLENGRVLWQA